MPPANRGPSPIVVALSGDVDLAVRDEVAATLDGGVACALDAGADLYVDLAAVTFMDSTGLSCIARACTALQDRGRALRLGNPTPATHRVLELAGLDRLVVSASGG